MSDENGRNAADSAPASDEHVDPTLSAHDARWEPEGSMIELPVGGRIHTSSAGYGPVIVFCNGLGVSAASFWAGIAGPLSQNNQVITWDYRGHGASDPPASVDRLTLDRCADDLSHVINHWGVGPAVVAGHSMGVQVALRFYRRHPDQVSALVSLLGTFERPLDNFFRLKSAAKAFDRLAGFAHRHPAGFARVWPYLFSPRLARPVAALLGIVRYKALPSGELEGYLRHLQVMDPAAVIQLAEDMQASSARDLLPDVAVPFLIFAGEEDLLTPVEASEEMQELAPGSALQVVPGGTHTALAEQPDLFWLRITYFLVAAGVWPAEL